VVFLIPSISLTGRQLHEKWTELQQLVPPCTPLYWAVADIWDAYGSVLLPRLYQILGEFYSDEAGPESGEYGGTRFYP
jgi:hypothetical protein